MELAIVHPTKQAEQRGVARRSRQGPLGTARLAGTLWPNMGVNEFSSDLPLDLT